MRIPSLKEYLCIELARLAELKHLENIWQEKYKKWLPKTQLDIGSPKSIFDDISAIETYKKILLLILFPIVIVILVFLFVLFLAAYCLETYEFYKQKRKAKAEINRLATCRPIECIELHDSVRSFGMLWAAYGLSRKHYSEAMMPLVLEWISTLYGEATLAELVLDQQLAKFKRAYADINVPYYRGDIEATHFYLRSPIESLIDVISDRLPSY